MPAIMFTGVIKTYRPSSSEDFARAVWIRRGPCIYYLPVSCGACRKCSHDRFNLIVCQLLSLVIYNKGYSVKTSRCLSRSRGKLNRSAVVKLNTFFSVCITDILDDICDFRMMFVCEHCCKSSK